MYVCIRMCMWFKIFTSTSLVSHLSSSHCFSEFHQNGSSSYISKRCHIWRSKDLPCQGVSKVIQATPTSWRRPHSHAGLPLPAPRPHAILTTSFHCTNTRLSHPPTPSTLPSFALAIFFLIFWSSLITAFLIHLPQLSLFLKVTARVTLLKISLGFLSSSSQHLECQLSLPRPNFHSSFRDQQLVIPCSCSWRSSALIAPSQSIILCFHDHLLY